MAKYGDRVFTDIIGYDPEIYFDGMVFTVVGRYVSPRLMHRLIWPSWLCALILAFAFCMAAFFKPIVLELMEGKMFHDADYNTKSFIIFIVLWIIFYIATKRWIAKNLKTTVRVSFSPNAVSWTSKTNGFVQLPLHQPREYRAERHQLGPKEARLFDNAQRQRAAAGQNRKLPDPAYQVSSEVFVHSGPEGMHWHIVAEIMDDEVLEKAGRLRGALIVADQTARRVAEKMQQQLEGPAEAGGSLD